MRCLPSCPAEKDAGAQHKHLFAGQQTPLPQPSCQDPTALNRKPKNPKLSVASHVGSERTKKLWP